MPCQQRVRHRVFAAALKRNHLTQDAAAKILGMSPQALGALIKDHSRTPRRLTPRQQEILCAWTGKLPEELWPRLIKRRGFYTRGAEAGRRLTPRLFASYDLLLVPPPPDEAVDRSERLYSIWRLLQQLLTPKQERTVRIAMEGATYEEIGADLEVSRAWVGKTMAKAFERLRAAPQLWELVAA